MNILRPLHVTATLNGKGIIVQGYENQWLESADHMESADSDLPNPEGVTHIEQLRQTNPD
ncbi:MAG: hypothetical protein M9928_20930 [Anaerolineae bacterium]|nr:hypothetical protein [Anaerolineae bacterium]MCO5199651.1 hypothetical protein [Anaerolineae bacterium]MCO5207479.1 hypothetical protein [Anaerolineae bacterium]